MDKEDTDMEANDVYVYVSIGAVEMRGKKWFVNLWLNGKIQKCQLDSGATCNVMSLRDKKRLALRGNLRPSTTMLKMYSDQGLPSLGIFTSDCVVWGRKYKLDFEVVNTRQLPLLSGFMSEEMGLMSSTIPEELKVEGLNAVDDSLALPFYRNGIITAYKDVFTSPVEAVQGGVHFELDPTIQPVQCAPRNIPVAMKQAVKAQLDKYEVEGHITSVSELAIRDDSPLLDALFNLAIRLDNGLRERRSERQDRDPTSLSRLLASLQRFLDPPSLRHLTSAVLWSQPVQRNPCNSAGSDSPRKRGRDGCPSGCASTAVRGGHFLICCPEVQKRLGSLAGRRSLVS